MSVVKRTQANTCTVPTFNISKVTAKNHSKVVEFGVFNHFCIFHDLKRATIKNQQRELQIHILASERERETLLVSIASKNLSAF